MKDLRSTIPINFDKDYPVRDVQDVTHIIVHHSATNQGSAKAYARYHIEAYDWPGIAYHYVIDKDGTVNWTLDHHKVGYHCKGMNRKSIGICLTGNFDGTRPTPEQFSSLVDLIVSLRTTNDWEIGFHNEYSLKTCPGKLFPKVELLETVHAVENPVHPDDEPEPEVPFSGPDFDEPDNPIIVTPPPVNDGRNNPGCLAFLIF
jgi:N-acetylmuramoyl-L-alanine amidase CwlA